jgi:hypothetical protein
MDPKCIYAEAKSGGAAQEYSEDLSPLRRALLRHLASYSGVTEPLPPCLELASIALEHPMRDDL